MAAAIAAAREGAHVTVLEKNDRAGKKVFISGKGRCNVTNDCDTADFFDHVMRGKKFLYSAVYGCDTARVQRFFEENGCPLKVERGGRVFPVSDKSSDIIRTLLRQMEALGVRICFDTRARRLRTEETREGVRAGGVISDTGEAFFADAVILATGGLSYPLTGATGDGLRMAGEAGHKITECTPSLVPFETKEAWCRDLQGLSLRNVRLYTEGKKGFDRQGEMLFTHFGVSGPLVLNASAYVEDARLPATYYIDLKPGLDEVTLDKRLQREFLLHGKKQFKNSLSSLFPARLIPVMVGLSQIEKEKSCARITAEERKRFAARIRKVPFTVSKKRGWDEAIVTRGGVSTADIDPSTMASRRCRGLYFAGEVMDVDALTGGFNLQIAWSTGVLAGRHAAHGGSVV